MSFYGLEIAKTGLFISQRAINVAGHNIANANTAGYTRQRVISEAIDPATLVTRFGTAANGTVGGGAQVQSLEQVRDSFLDKELRREYGDGSMWSTRTDALEYIETMFDETDSGSLSKSLAGFFQAVLEFSNEPDSEEIRTNLRQSGITLTDTFHNFYEQLTEMRKTQNDSVASAVLSANDILDNIAAYNKSIAGYELSGEKANDLRDKRNVQLDELSKLVDIEYNYDSNGYLNVSVGGTTLLSHTTVTHLETVTNPTTGMYDVVLEGTATPLNFTSGELAAYVQMRDGASADNIGIPYLLNGLNTLAQSLAKEMNAVHSAGWTRATTSTASVSGINLFEVPSNDYSLITAGNFSISDEVLASVNNLAASDTQIVLSSTNPQAGNNKTALALSALCSAQNLANVSSFQGYLKGFIVEIAIESAHAQTMFESQTAVIQNLETRRESVSGVSVDEEMVNLIKSQQMYAASSRIITAIDESLDILINRTGIVGRG